MVKTSGIKNVVVEPIWKGTLFLRTKADLSPGELSEWMVSFFPDPGKWCLERLIDPERKDPDYMAVAWASNRQDLISAIARYMKIMPCPDALRIIWEKFPETSYD